MDKRITLLFVFLYSNTLKADTSNNVLKQVLSYTEEGYLTSSPIICSTILEEFAHHASKFTKCSLLNARPIKLCSNCIEEYVKFHETYQQLLSTVVNGTSCKSIYISQDRLDVVLEYHDNILSVWDKGHCSGCFDWSAGTPVLSNETSNFNIKYTETKSCISKHNSDEVCNKCMQSYVLLDNYYKSLSTDSIGVDSICMDIVDSMNATRSIWSKTLNCCKLRQTPEILFLCCCAIISSLPLLYYLVLRYFGPMRDLHNVLKQSRFRQTLLRSRNERIN